MKASAQDTLTTFYDKERKKITDGKVAFVRKARKQQSVQEVCDYFVGPSARTSGDNPCEGNSSNAISYYALLIAGAYSDDQLKKEEELFTYYHYHFPGNIASKGFYRNGQQEGL